MSHLQDVSYDTFMEDDEKQDAVIRCLMVIGEAAGRLSDEARGSLPDFDWYAMKAMRHVLIHDYGRIDLERVWDVATTHVPRLEREVRDFLGRIP
jgi:uncharacterized protein with HEPN domain